MPQLFQTPKPAPNVALPQEPPNRPLGKDWLRDAVDVVLGGLGVQGMFGLGSSKAADIGELLGAAMPMVGVAKAAAPTLKAARALETAAPAMEAAPQGIRAFHGSPHDFEKFSTAKIGTGEGAQAYGHGLYFAENEGVARGYKSALTDFGFPDGDPRTGIATVLANKGEDAGLPMVRKAWSNLGDRLEPAIDEARKAVAANGRIYEVNLKANPEHFLDWDKPLSQQSPEVQKALTQIDPERMSIIRNKSFDISAGKFYDDLAENLGTNHQVSYGTVRHESQPAASQRLREAGVPGIKYLDQGSRDTGNGTRNFVVFDDQIIDILKKYGIVLPFAGAAAAAAPTQGGQQ